MVRGTLVKYNLGNSVVSKVIDFSNTLGHDENTNLNLTYVNNNDKVFNGSDLYLMKSLGGNFNKGTILKVNTLTNTVIKLYDLNTTSAHAVLSKGYQTIYNNTLYSFFDAELVKTDLNTNTSTLITNAFNFFAANRFLTKAERYGDKIYFAFQNAIGIYDLVTDSGSGTIVGFAAYALFLDNGFVYYFNFDNIITEKYEVATGILTNNTTHTLLPTTRLFNGFHDQANNLFYYTTGASQLAQDELNVYDISAQTKHYYL